MRKFRFLMPIGFLAIAAGFSAAVMVLWNWLMPSLFGLITISFWQAVGIFVLCRLLFGSFSGGHKIMFGGMHGKNPILEKWLKMNSEERKEFIRKKKEHLTKGDFSGLAHHVFDVDENMPKENE